MGWVHVKHQPTILSSIAGVRFPPGLSIHGHCHQWSPSAGRSPGLHLEAVQQHTPSGPAWIVQLQVCHHEANLVKSALIFQNGILLFFTETFIPVCNKSSWMYTSPRLACPSPALCGTARALLLWAVWVALQLGWMGNNRRRAALCPSEHHLSRSQSTNELLCSHRSDLCLDIGAVSRTGLSLVALPLCWLHGCL